MFVPRITQNGVAIANAQPTYASGGGNQGPLAGNDTAFFSEGQFLNDLNRFFLSTSFGEIIRGSDGNKVTFDFQDFIDVDTQLINDDNQPGIDYTRLGGIIW